VRQEAEVLEHHRHLVAPHIEQGLLVGLGDVDVADRGRTDVGSMSRVRQRISVDFPLPDSPITTNTSPGATSMSMSRIATTLPVCVCSWRRGKSANSDPTICSGFGP
jgi:hypothetical protein